MKEFKKVVVASDDTRTVRLCRHPHHENGIRSPDKPDWYQIEVVIVRGTEAKVKRLMITKEELVRIHALAMEKYESDKE